MDDLGEKTLNDYNAAVSQLTRVGQMPDIVALVQGSIPEGKTLSDIFDICDAYYDCHEDADEIDENLLETLAIVFHGSPGAAEYALLLYDIRDHVNGYVLALHDEKNKTAPVLSCRREQQAELKALTEILIEFAGMGKQQAAQTIRRFQTAANALVNDSEYQITIT